MRVDNLSHRPAHQLHGQLSHRPSHTDNNLGHRPFFQLEDELEKQEMQEGQVGVAFKEIRKLLISLSILHLGQRI